ncbi:MAG: hypothetical protein J6Q67_04750 [Clostridia bacterium]|nr:hypothetical protein [Clostridia bacterium]
MFILQTVLEFSVATFIIWALFNEEKLVDFEKKIINKIKARARSESKRNTYHRQSTVTNGKNCA